MRKISRRKINNLSIRDDYQINLVLILTSQKNESTGANKTGETLGDKCRSSRPSFHNFPLDHLSTFTRTIRAVLRSSGHALVSVFSSTLCCNHHVPELAL